MFFYHARQDRTKSHRPRRSGCQTYARKCQGYMSANYHAHIDILFQIYHRTRRNDWIRHWSCEMQHLKKNFSNIHFLIKWSLISTNPHFHTPVTLIRHFDTSLEGKSHSFSDPEIRRSNTSLSHNAATSTRRFNTYLHFDTSLPQLTNLCSIDQFLFKWRVELTNLHWSDVFKWQITRAEKEWSLCGSDVLKWRVLKRVLSYIKNSPDSIKNDEHLSFRSWNSHFETLCRKFNFSYVIWIYYIKRMNHYFFVAWDIFD